MSSYDKRIKDIKSESKNKSNSLNYIYKCKKCCEIPLIQFNSENDNIIINAKCKCGINNNDILNFKNNYLNQEIQREKLSNIFNSFFYCLNCKYYICDSCKSKHEKVVKRKHNIINLCCLEKNQKEYKLCEEKNNLLYCLNCQKGICIICKDNHINQKHNITKTYSLISKSDIQNFSNVLEKAKENYNIQKAKILFQIDELKTILKDIEKQFYEMNSKNQSLINIIENIFKSYIVYQENFNYEIFSNFKNLLKLNPNKELFSNTILGENIIKKSKEYLSKIKKGYLFIQINISEENLNESILTSMRDSKSSVNKSLEDLSFNLNHEKNKKKSKIIKLNKNQIKKGSLDKKSISHLNKINYGLDFENNYKNYSPKNIKINLYQQTIEKINNLIDQQRNSQTNKKNILKKKLSYSKDDYKKSYLNIYETSSIIKKIKQSKEKKNINKINTNRSLSPRIKDNHLYNQKKIPVRTLDKYFKSISQSRLIDSPFSKINYNIRTDESTRASGSREFNFNYSLISNK